ncbi:MAG: sulfotransferase family protein [Acidimicrobiales bacterium]
MASTDLAESAAEAARGAARHLVAAGTQVWKERVPRHRQQQVIEARLVGRRLFDPRRPLPDFLVIGAQRAGTSSLYKWLEGHPQVVASLRKETEYLTARWCRGEAWYRGHFASRSRRGLFARHQGRPLMSFEASPNYLFHPLAPARAGMLMPGARLVALLRNPVDRAYSHYQHEVRSGRERLGFEAALDAEETRLAGEEDQMAADPCYRSLAWEQSSYTSRGRYADQLARWFAVFDPSRLMVVRSEDLYADTATTYARITDFLGLDPWQPEKFANFSYTANRARAVPVESLAPATRRRLQEVFTEPNRRLGRLLGTDPGWW